MGMNPNLNNDEFDAIAGQIESGAKMEESWMQHIREEHQLIDEDLNEFEGMPSDIHAEHHYHADIFHEH